MNLAKRTRLELGLTQAEFSELLGKSLRTVQHWESASSTEDKALRYACHHLRRQNFAELFGKDWDSMTDDEDSTLSFEDKALIRACRQLRQQHEENQK